MGTMTVIWWRDIPAQVTAREGRRQSKIVLHPRFQVDHTDQTGFRDRTKIEVNLSRRSTLSSNPSQLRLRGDSYTGQGSFWHHLTQGRKDAEAQGLLFAPLRLCVEFPPTSPVYLPAAAPA